MRMCCVPWSTSLKQLVKRGFIQLTANCGRQFFCAWRGLSPADHELQGKKSTWGCWTDFSWALEKHRCCSQPWCNWGLWHGPGRWRALLQVSGVLGKTMPVTLNEFWSLLDKSIGSLSTEAGTELSAVACNLDAGQLAGSPVPLRYDFFLSLLHSSCQSTLQIATP